MLVRVLHCGGMKAECAVSCIAVQVSAALIVFIYFTTFCFGVHYFIVGDKHENGTNELSELQFST